MKESEILSECQSFKTEYQDFVDSIIIHDEEGDFDTKQSPDATTSSYGMITIRTKELRVLKVKLGNRGWEVSDSENYWKQTTKKYLVQCLT